ncbi:hypothetical protein QF03_005363, partial [Salmonella enterica subsp. enterica]|nr:hypothetical protein [Salmonella enterica subsp. enterica]
PGMPVLCRMRKALHSLSATSRRLSTRTGSVLQRILHFFETGDPGILAALRACAQTPTGTMVRQTAAQRGTTGNDQRAAHTPPPEKDVIRHPGPCSRSCTTVHSFAQFF